MKRYGPDSLNSWIIACACCFINMMLYGMSRLSGMLFVASVPRFQVTREKASFPYTFGIFTRNIAGPLVGYLGKTFGVRSVTTMGCILGCIGAGSCYFAENINIVTLFWGVIFGLGFGLGNILLPVSINQYFDKHKATASGVSFTGACLGSIVLPPIVEILINKYGLSGTYLFLSGFILICVPAALLLKKPNFQINECSQKSHEYVNETERIVSGAKVKLYTVEDRYRSPLGKLKEKKNINTTHNADDEHTQNTILSYEDQSKQKLLPEYKIRMSTSENFNTDQISANNKGRRQVNINVLESEIDSFTSPNTDTDLYSEKDEYSEKDFRSHSVQYEKPKIGFTFIRIRTLSSSDLTSYNTDAFKTNALTGYQNYGYQNNINDSKFMNATDLFPNYALKDNISPTDSQPAEKSVTHSNSYQRNVNYISPPENFKTNLNIADISKRDTDIENFKVSHGKLSSSSDTKIFKTDETSGFGFLSIIFDPMYNLIAITNAIYALIFVCMITIIVDFSRDLNIGVSNEKYVLMALSVGDVIGRLGLGWVTDCGFMTTANFVALCFATQGIFAVTLVWADGLITLMILITFYGVAESGIIVVLPVIFSEYLGTDNQTVAIGSSNFLSGPMCLAISPLIGYFRDTLGSYNSIFYGNCLVSFICCLSWLLAPCITKCRRNR